MSISGSWPAIRAYRILRPLQSYRDLSEDDFPDEFQQLSFNIQGKRIGMYQNELHTFEETLIITDCGIHICKYKKLIFVPFSDMLKVSLPPKNLLDIRQEREISITLRDGRIVDLPVRGSVGKFKDIFEVARFLNRVVKDITCGITGEK